MPTAIEPDLIFFHIPKCGGTSVNDALHGAGLELGFNSVGLWPLLRDHGRGDELIRRLKTVFPINSILAFPQAHLPAALVRELVPAETWDRSFKFAFVRNPWDLLVSTYSFIRSNLRHFDAFEPDYAAAVADSSFAQFVQLYPMIASDMTSMIVDADGNVTADFVGRFERIEADFAYICERLRLGAALPHVNRSEHDHYRAYYDDETKGIVERHFARDIARFGYTF